ncbi:MAG: peroxiredoxin [Polyangiaceae bacterium]|nr:peroxiredoxin [Polyangiaceae bacterium]
MAAKKPTSPTAAKPTAAKPKPAPAPKPAPKSSPLTIGAPAPAFSLPADDGTTVSLASLRGRRVVLYFYPKDDTPGCTRESCAFQASLGELGDVGAVVLGISRDGAASHQRFRAKYGLTFPLLTDADRAVHEAYGAWGTKTMYGKRVEGVIRTTVLLDERGRVSRVFSPVKVDGHAAAVLAALG